MVTPVRFACANVASIRSPVLDIVLTNAASSTVAVLENSIPQGQFVASFVSKTYNVGNGMKFVPSVR